MFHTSTTPPKKEKVIYLFRVPKSFFNSFYFLKENLWKYTAGDFFLDPFPTFCAFCVPCGACMIHGMAMERATLGQIFI